MSKIPNQGTKHLFEFSIYFTLPILIVYRVFPSRFAFNCLCLVVFVISFVVFPLSLSACVYVCVFECVCLYRLSLCSLAYDTVMMYFIATTKPKQSTKPTQRNVMARPQTPSLIQCRVLIPPPRPPLPRPERKPATL